MSDGGGDSGGGGDDFGGGDDNYGGSDNYDGYNDNHHYNNNHYHDNHYYDNNYHDSPSQPAGPCMKICTIALTGIVGAIFTAVGVYLITGSLERQGSLLLTIGTIVDTYYCGGNDGQKTYGAIIEYFDEVNEETYTFQSNSCSSWRPRIGNSIDVRYDPDSPGYGVDASFLGTWLLPAIVLGLGSVAFCAFFSCLICYCLCGRNNGGGAESEETYQYDADPEPSGLTQANVYGNNTNNSNIEHAHSSSTPSNGQNQSSTQNQNTNAGGTSLFDQMISGMEK